MWIITNKKDGVTRSYLRMAEMNVCEVQHRRGGTFTCACRILPEAAMLAHYSLRDLQLKDCEVTADAVARLAVVAARLRVLHLVG